MDMNLAAGIVTMTTILQKEQDQRLSWSCSDGKEGLILSFRLAFDKRLF